MHRDLKPANLFVTGDGLVKILDFGLAKLAGPEPGADSTRTPEHPATEPGTVLGHGRLHVARAGAGSIRADHRSDIFSFGAVLYEMLSGERAFLEEIPLRTRSPPS